MNTGINNNFRGLLIIMLVAAGIATTVATGGGGSGGGSGGDAEPADPTLLITAENGHDVASVAILAFGMSFDLGDITRGEVMPQAFGMAPAVLRLTGVDDLAQKPLGNDAHKLESCAVAGTVTVTGVIADPNTLTVGDQITAVFENCDDNEGFVIDGRLDLTVGAVEGDMRTGVFLLSLSIVMSDVVITEGTQAVTTDGDFMLTLDNLGLPVFVVSLTGSELQLGSAPELLSLTDFSHTLVVDASVIPDTKLAQVAGRLGSLLLGGTVDYETVSPVRGIGDNDPHTGEILITGADSSTVRIVIVDSSSVVLQIDTTGDGVVDDFVDTSWAALNGQTSMITSSSAPDIAREVINAVTGFGSVAVTAGGQFHPSAAFGRLQQLAVSGDFGPLVIDCLGGGSATVSGFVGLAGTFSAGDQLATALTACSRGAETLNGGLDVSVSSYQETPGAAYLFAGAVTETGLERTAGGNVFSGTGTFITSYDYVFTSPGFIYVSAAADSFTIGSGGVDRQLSGATLDTQIPVGPAPVTITRSSSGSITSAALNGSFTYQSIVADSFLFDSDSATGPFSGELLVTASDASTLRIVALDEFGVRLEIDLDGDTITDTEINTTWASLL